MGDIIITNNINFKLIWIGFVRMLTVSQSQWPRNWLLDTKTDAEGFDRLDGNCWCFYTVYIRWRCQMEKMGFQVVCDLITIESLLVFFVFEERSNPFVFTVYSRAIELMSLLLTVQVQAAFYSLVLKCTLLYVILL